MMDHLEGALYNNLPTSQGATLLDLIKGWLTANFLHCRLSTNDRDIDGHQEEVEIELLSYGKIFFNCDVSPS